MAQLVARLHGMEEVWGSNPHSSTCGWGLLFASESLLAAGPFVIHTGGRPPEPPDAGASPPHPHGLASLGGTG
jgi:hypothetical protein